MKVPTDEAPTERPQPPGDQLPAAPGSQTMIARPRVVPRDDLVDLLRKCHIDELEGLAAMLRIKSAGMPLATLAKAIDLRFRRAAASEFYTLARGGSPPEYMDVLRHIGIRLGVELPHTVDLAELVIVRQQIRRQWPKLPQEEQRKRWLGAIQTGDSTAPVEAEQAMELLDQRYRQGVGLFLARLVTEPAVPMPGCLFLFWLARPRDDLVLPAIIEICRLRHALRHRVTVGIVGSPSSGKDAAMKALFGIDTGNVNPVAGSTTRVEIRKLPRSTALFVVNTPGMGDVIESVTEEAKAVLDHIDVYLYLVNAQGGVQARELSDYEACRRRGRPVLAVINKIDTLRESDRARFIDDCRTKLRADDDDILPAAFDPLPQLCDAPIGIGEIQSWMERHLSDLGKDRAELPWNQG